MGYVMLITIVYMQYYRTSIGNGKYVLRRCSMPATVVKPQEKETASSLFNASMPADRVRAQTSNHKPASKHAERQTHPVRVLVIVAVG